MKARIAAALGLILLLVSGLAAAAEPLDVVVMVDVSASMFPVFDDLKQYLLRDLPENYLHAGDTFHLLSFADTPEEEISVRIGAPADLESAIQRILLLQPLGHYTDLIAALDFLYEYTRALPGENGKLVLLLTDGIHDPPPGSPNRLEASQTVARILESTEKIHRAGWDVHILQMPRGEGAGVPSESKPGVPQVGAAPPGEPEAGKPGAPQVGAAPPGEPEAGKPGVPQVGAALPEGPGAVGTAETGQDVLQTLIDRLQAPTTVYAEVEKGQITGKLTGFSTLHFPTEPLGRVRRRLVVPMEVSNFSATPQRYTVVGVQNRDHQLLRRPVTVEVPPDQSSDLPVPLRLPSRRVLPAGEQSLRLEFRFSEDTPRISPLAGDIRIDYIGSLAWLPRIALPYLPYAIGILVLVLALLALGLFVRRRLQDAAFARFFEGLAERRGVRIRPLILRVDEQNPNIGARNIHRVVPGASLSVGGDGSAFVIFYVPMPRRIGVIRNEKGRYVFVPKRLEHFIDLEQPLADCLGKPIRAVSSRGHQVTLRFHEYVSPLEELNRLMRSIRQAGKQPPETPPEAQGGLKG